MPISKVFQGPPWTSAESLTFTVRDKGVPGEGRCVLTTIPGAEVGKTRLSRSCSKDEFLDEGSVLVESASLRPLSAERTYVDTKKNQITKHTITYDANAAKFRTDDGKKTRETTRELPKADAKNPDPGWYDDESLLWLARGLQLKSGYRAGYAHVINAGQPRVLTVEVQVDGPETITVPAGEFKAWRVRYQREDSVYFVWVDVQSPQRMIKARIEDVVYELASIK